MKYVQAMLAATALCALAVGTAHAGSIGATTSSTTTVTGTTMATGTASATIVGSDNTVASASAVSSPGLQTTNTRASNTNLAISHTFTGLGGTASASVAANGMGSANAWISR
jgi:hypothetical protein